MKTSDHDLLPFAIRIEHLPENFQVEQIINLLKLSMKGAE